MTAIVRLGNQQLTGMLFMGVSAFILLPIGTWFAIETSSFLQKATRAPGEVIDLVERRDDDGVSYLPVVRFRTADGDERVFEGAVAANPPSYEIGDAVEVLYEASAPDDARIDSFLQLWFVPALTGFMALGFAIIGSTVVIKARREG